jgi:DNA polymerase elongation subunit (family B)
MVSHQLIKPVYQGTHMEVVGRSETGKKVIMTDYSHTSHFYVREDAYVPDHPSILAVETINNLDPDYWVPFPLYGSIKREKLKRIWVKKPTDVPELRDDYFDETWEADIKYNRRYLIDKGIINGFDENLEPVDFELPPEVCVVDIEILNRLKQEFEDLVRRLNEPVAICGLKFKENENPIIICVDREQKRHKVVKLTDRTIMYVNSEVHLHIWFWKILKTKFPDVITGWNVDFDIDYMIGRGKKLAELSGKYNIELRNLLAEKFIKYINIFDSMRGYDRIYEPVRKGLKYIARILGISKRSEWGGARFYETYMKSQEEAIQYNIDDVNDTWNIIKLVDLVQYYWEDKNFTGVEELRLTFFNSIKIDTVCLRHALGRFALPTAPKYEEKPDEPQFKGAFVVDPIRGVHFFVGLFDFSRFYPAMVKTKNISYEIPVGHPELGFMPEVVDIFWEARDSIEEKIEKLTPGTPEYKILHPKKMSRKFLLNAVWGVFGDISFRLYDKEKAGMITRLCRAGIKMLIQFAKKLGFISLYGDTDSVFIHIPIDIVGKLKDIINKIVEKSKWIAEKVNKAFKTVFKTDLINVKLEKVWHPLCLTSVKKKYFGRVVWEEGKFVDRVITRGMESVRRDSSELTKKVQQKLYDMILYGNVDKVLGYLKKVLTMTKAGMFTLDAIAIGKGLTKNPDKYVANTDYIRGSRYANKHYYKSKKMKAGMRAFMFFIQKVLDPELPKYDVICLKDPNDLDTKRIQVDLFKTVERNLEKPLEHLLDISGLRWKDIKGQIKIGALIKRKKK